MILKALTLENFKGIREPVRIELSPITLLFGPNNAGKSTVLHALIYARELFERGNADPRFTQMGGDTIDLGGFDSLVFGNDRSRRIRMRFEFEVSATELIDDPRERTFGTVVTSSEDGSERYEASASWKVSRLNIAQETIPSVREIVERHPLRWLEVAICWSKQHHRALVLSCSTGENQRVQPSVELTLNEKLNAVELTSLDFGIFQLAKIETQEFRTFRKEILEEVEPLLKSIRSRSALLEESVKFQGGKKWEEWKQRKSEEDSELKRLAKKLEETIDALSDFSISTPDFLRGLIRPSCLTDDGRLKPLQVFPGPSALPDRNHWLSVLSLSYDMDPMTGEEPLEACDWFEPEEVIFSLLDPLINACMTGFVNACRPYFANSLYLSAMRVNPPRDFHPVQPVDPKRWSSGLAAWDLLFAKEHELLDVLNAWLSGDPKRFASGFEVEVQHTKQVDVRQNPIAELLASAESITLDEVREHILALPEQRLLRIRNLGTGALGHPRDIGYGLSQLLPVIVAALDTKSGIVSVEEPESNIHPAFQVVLADLFISQAKANPDALFLIETHSEHLMLRCLRRIRETSQGQLAEGDPSLRPDEIAVHFVEPSAGSPRFHRIRIDEDGEFLDPWPRGFFSERMTEVYGDDL